MNICNTFSFAARLSKLPRNVRNRTDEELHELMLWCTLADPTKNALWMDPDRAKLVQYLPKFINEDLSGRLQLTIWTLISAYPLCLQDARNNVAGVFYSGRPHCLKELHAEYIGWQSITKSAIPRIIPRFQDISAESVQSWHKLLLHFAGRMPSQNCLGGYQRQYTREYFHDADYTKEGVKLLEWCVQCWNRKECNRLNSIDNYREGRVVN